MGELLLSLPAVHAAREAFPKAQITLLVQQGLEPLIEGHPDVDRILTCSPEEGKGWVGAFRVARRLRKERFDSAIILNPTKLFHVAAFLAGIPTRIGYHRKLGVLLTLSIPDTKVFRNHHEVNYNLELVRLLGIPASPSTLHLPTDPEKESQAQQLMNACGIALGHHPIAIHPWTSNPQKSWPLESFGEVTRLLQKSGHTIVVIGGPESIHSMDEAKPMFSTGYINLVGRVPLGILPALLKQCAVLVSNDSGPVHVAAAVGTPTVVVAPCNHGSLLARWRPLGEGHHLLLSPVPEEVTAAVQESLSIQGHRRTG